MASTCQRECDKALLIALQYTSSTDKYATPLPTPYQDADLLERYLCERGYLKKNIVVMKDNDNIAPSLRPTRENIYREIEKFVTDVRPGDKLVFFFAGHGYQILNRSGTEEDERDEVILVDGNFGAPVNSNRTPFDPEQLRTLPRDHPDRQKLDGIIIDNDLRERLVDPLPSGARLLAIFDTCHSGTMLDLPSNCKLKGPLYLTAPPASPPSQASTFHLDDSKPLSTSPEACKTVFGQEAYHIEPPTVICISATEDRQQAWDVGDNTMLRILLKILAEVEGTIIPLREIMRMLNNRLENIRLNAGISKRKQRPQLSSFSNLAFSQPLEI